MKKNDEATKKRVCLGLLTHPLFLLCKLEYLELNPGQLLPNSLKRTMGMILEPEVGEEALYYHHGDAHKESVGDAELRLEIKAIISKQSTTDDRLDRKSVV